METEREGRYKARTQSPCALIRLSAGLTKSVRMHINPTLSHSDMTLMQPKKYTTKKRQHANNALSHIPACTSSNIIWPPPAIPLPAHSLCVSSSLACGRHPRCSSVRRRAGRERQRAAQETHTTSKCDAYAFHHSRNRLLRGSKNNFSKFAAPKSFDRSSVLLCFETVFHFVFSQSLLYKDTAHDGPAIIKYGSRQYAT